MTIINKQTVRFFFGLLSLLVILGGCSEKAKRKILVVHSYESSYAAYPDFNNLIVSEFKKQGINPEIRTIYLDCEAFPNEESELKHMTFLLDSVSTGWTPEVILVNEDQAAYSLLKCSRPLVRKVPVVFSGVSFPNWELLKEYPNVTGFHDKMDILANIRMALDLFKDQAQLFTILDSTFLDMRIRAMAKEQLKGQNITGFIDAPELSRKEQDSLYKQKGYIRFTAVAVRTYNRFEGTTGLNWVLNRQYDRQCYIQLKRDITTKCIGSLSNCPCFTAINEGFGYNEKLLGGYITPLPVQVEEATGSAARILNGAKASEIPITESRKAYMMDWQVMQQLNISPNQIPAGYTIINLPLQEKYPFLWTAALLTGMILLVSLITCLLYLYLREQERKKKALHDLADEKQTLALAIAGGSTYAWKFEKGFFIFEEAFSKSQNISSRKLSFEDLLLFIHPEHWGSMSQNWEKRSSDKNKVLQVRCDFNGNGYQWWELRYTCNDSDPENPKTAGLLLNIQDVKNREHELEENRMLAEKAELKESFLANMSHEIRTPLNAIVGFSNILASDAELEQVERRNYMNIINQNNELLLKLINDVVELSRIESGNMSFHISKCFVSEILESIYMTYQVLIPPHLEFIKEDNPVEIEIHVDKGRLTQVLTNLLNNASKFTEKGYIKIGCHYFPEKEKVGIYVEDTGRGISREEQKMIFNRFYKQNEFAQGAGLGLSICLVIIEKLKGSIELTSEPGKGSRFTVFLPGRAV